jgi:hypothetical protein
MGDETRRKGRLTRSSSGQFPSSLDAVPLAFAFQTHVLSGLGFLSLFQRASFSPLRTCLGFGLSSATKVRSGRRLDRRSTRTKPA